MTTLQDTIRRIGRRQLLDLSLRKCGIGAVFGLIAALVALIADRLLGLNVSGSVYVAAPVVGALAGFVFASINGPAPFEIARDLDRSLRLKDRMATAHAIGTGRFPGSADVTDNTFAALVQRDADRLAARIDARSVSPVRVSPVWGGAAALAVLLWAGVLYLPHLPRAAAAQPQFAAETDQRVQEREHVAAAIERTINEIRDQAAHDERTRERLEALERLHAQLTADDPAERIDPAAARDESAAHLSELADSFAQQAQRDEMAADELARRFSSMETPESPMSATDFQEALHRGDFGRAAQALDELLGRRDELPPQERRDLAEHMREISNRIDGMTEAERRELEERMAQLEQALRDQGIDEDAMRELMERLAQGERADDVMRDQPIDDAEIAERLARELEGMQERQDLAERMERDAESVRDALRETAEEIERDDMGSAPEQDREPEPGAAPEDEQSRPDVEEREATPDEPEGERREQVEREAGDDREEGRVERAAQPDEAQEEPGKGDEEREVIEEREAADDRDEAGRPEGEGVDEGQEHQPQQPRSARDAMREIEERRRSARDRREVSERLREQTRRMAESMDEEQRRQWSAAREQMQPGTGDEAGRDGRRTPPTDEAAPLERDRIEDIDARAFEDDPGEVIAEWLSDEPHEIGDATPRRAAPTERAREAQRVAERAVNEQAVPARYHELIRRYFGRLPDTVERAADE
jgi:hypothetical protein